MQGVAYVRFGLLTEDGVKTFLRGLENQTKVGRRVGGVRKVKEEKDVRWKTCLMPCPVFFFVPAGRWSVPHFPFKG